MRDVSRCEKESDEETHTFTIGPQEGARCSPFLEGAAINHFFIQHGDICSVGAVVVFGRVWRGEPAEVGMTICHGSSTVCYRIVF